MWPTRRRAAASGTHQNPPATDVDLRTAEGNSLLVERAIDRFGRIDASTLVTGIGIITGRFLEIAVKQWERTKTGNLDVVLHGLQAFVPPMISQGSGDIVVFTSATGARPEPRVSTYSATRAGANALVRAVGLEHARDGPCINAIGSNFMDFPGFLRALAVGPRRGRRCRRGHRVELFVSRSLDLVRQPVAPRARPQHGGRPSGRVPVRPGAAGRRSVAQGTAGRRSVAPVAPPPFRRPRPGEVDPRRTHCGRQREGVIPAALLQGAA